MASGAIRAIICAGPCRAAKATVKLNRYSPSGSTHSIGTATMSVVRKVLVASISPDGTKA